MSILSNIWGGITGAVSNAYNTVSGLFGGGGTSAASINALNYNNPVNNALQANNSATPNYSAYNPQPTLAAGTTKGSNGLYGNSSTPVYGTPTSTMGNLVYGPSTPTSVKSGTTTSLNSTYSSPSYSGVSSMNQQVSSSPVSKNISVNGLSSGGTPISTPSSPSGTNYHGTVIGNNISVGANPETGMFQTQQDQQTPTQTPEEKNKKTFSDYIAALKSPASQADAYNRAQQESGLLAAQQQRNNTQNQVNGVTSQMNTDLLRLRDTAGREGVTEAVYGGQQAQVTREATIKLLPLQAQLASDQSNLQLAQEHLDTLFSIYSKDAQNSVDFYNKNVTAAYDFYTSEEKKKVDELTQQKQFNADLVKSDASNQKSLALKLLESGNTAGYKAITGIQIPSNVNSPTFQQDYANYQRDISNVVSQYGGSVGLVDRQIQQQQLQNTILTGQKLKNEIDAGKSVTGEYAPIINAVSSLVGSTKAPAVKQAIATAIVNGDFNTAYANVANAVEDSLTGSNKTKFADTRTDIGVMQGMRNAIKEYTDAGGNLGYLKGTADTISKKFGQLSTDPKFAALGVQLQREFQAYRLAMTGAAFSPAESKEYAAVNPRTNASLDLNLATIDGALAQLTNRVTSTVNQRIPEAQKLYNLANGSGNQTSSAPVTSGATSSGVKFKVIK